MFLLTPSQTKIIYFDFGSAAFVDLVAFLGKIIYVGLARN